MPILINMKKKAGVDQWAGEVYNAKDGKTYSSTIKPIGSDKVEIQGCVLGFLCGGETWTRVAGPIPSSPANGMAKRRTQNPPENYGHKQPEPVSCGGRENAGSEASGSNRFGWRYLPNPRHCAA